MHKNEEDDNGEGEQKSWARMMSPINDWIDEVVQVSVGSTKKCVGQAEQESIEEAEAQRINEMSVTSWMSSDEDVDNHHDCIPSMSQCVIEAFISAIVN